MNVPIHAAYSISDDLYDDTLTPVRAESWTVDATDNHPEGICLFLRPEGTAPVEVVLSIDDLLDVLEAEGYVLPFETVEDDFGPVGTRFE